VTETPVNAIPSALERFDLLAARLAGKRPALFLDYDGTLTPIVDHPEKAIMSAESRAAVDALARKLPVAVISGRDRENVEAKVGIDSLIFAGSHGFDIKVPGGGKIGHEVGADYAPLLDATEAKLHAMIDPVAGSLVERKRFSIAAHYRNVAPEQAHRVADAVATIIAAEPKLKMKPGKMVFELQPAIDWDKGKAVLWLLQALKLDRPDVVPMFFGDDVTDEDAFRALAGGVGVGVVVADPGDAERRSHAEFRVDDVDQVIELLRRLTPA